MNPAPPRRLPWLVPFGIAFAVALLFALATQHAWEDYYITYRASKNLATGHGLVFTPGERLHTFTSPLGVLLPALASVLTLNRSDAGALWLFRLMSCAAFGGAAVLVFRLCTRRTSALLTGALAVAWLCTDVKSVDFTINGMETAFMLLFLAYTLWALFAAAPEHRARHLGLAWAGLMWTRPDSFIYIGLLGGGAWLFSDREAGAPTRRERLGDYAKAAALCTVLYLPWFLTAWWYYGSPVPHTIIAKASVTQVPWTFSSLLMTLVSMPKLAWMGRSTMEGAFLPTYYAAGGWPHALIIAERAFAIATAALWLCPRFGTWIRTASLGFLGAHVYLTYFPYYPFPWYLPPSALFAFVAWSGVLGHAIAAARKDGRWSAAGRLVTVVAGTQLAVQLAMFFAAGQQMAALQRYIDTGNREKIGRWLAEHADRTDRVFLEPLGYIGYYSGLKTFDWPGLSSREVVEAHRKVGAEWAQIIDYLAPDWLVLRPGEVQQINRQMPTLLATTYEKARDFDVRSDIAPLHIAGKHLLEMDAEFAVYHRRWGKHFVTEAGDVETRYPGPLTYATIENIKVRLVHAPGSLTVRVPAGARHVHVPFAISPAAYAADPKTDGAGFQMVWVDGTEQKILQYRFLNPAANPDDRHVGHFEADLPPARSDAPKLVLRTLPGATDTKDWTCWGEVDFR